jgi:ATP-dependent DNA helicase RecG
MHFSRDFKFQAYEMAKQQIAQGNQVYIVYPVIEESYALDIDGARKMYEEFREGEFRGFRLGLIHGKLPRKEQERLMEDFTSGKIDLLVSTTILEVGIDVPDATCMIIEHAERFGLSQLHQLRGRVGRGTRQSMCLLISDTATPESQARVKAMVEHSSGFEIAQEDLKIRGPGEFFGRRQHGLTELRIGNPLTQMQLLKRAREEAIRLVNADPGLQQRQHLLLKERLVQRFPEYERLMLVG